MSGNEKSIKSSYTVVYNLREKKWIVSGEGGWSEIHLCRDSSDGTYRLLAWTCSQTQDVLMNCNVTSECVYKEKSKNFHSFTDENGERYGLGFHKSQAGLTQAAELLDAVTTVVEESKAQEAAFNHHIEQNPQPEYEVNAPSATAAYADYQQQQPNNSNSNYGMSQNENTAVNNSGSAPGPPPVPTAYNGGNTNQTQQQSHGLPSPTQTNHNTQYQAQAQEQKQQIQQQQPSYQQPFQYNQQPSAFSTQASINATLNTFSPQPQYEEPNNYSNNNNSTGNLSPVSRALQGQYVDPVPKSSGAFMLQDPSANYTPMPHNRAPVLGDMVILPPKIQKHEQSDANVQLPHAVSHVRHVSFDHSQGIYVGLPPEWMEELNRQFGVQPAQLRGVQLHYDSLIPKVLIDLKEKLFVKEGYKLQGIFRLAPNAEDSNMMKQSINRGEFSSANEMDVNVYANLIKVWFRDLPDPLLGCIHPDIVESVQNVEQATNVVQNELREPNRSIYLWLCDMCCEIAQYSDVNRMGAQNLAIVIGPNLFNTMTIENPMRAMTYSQKVVAFMQKTIEWRQTVIFNN